MNRNVEQSPTVKKDMWFVLGTEMWNSQEKTCSLFQETRCGTIKKDMQSVQGTKLWNSQQRYLVCSMNRNVEQGPTVKKDI
jgi:hypothetical protein